MKGLIMTVLKGQTAVSMLVGTLIVGLAVQGLTPATAAGPDAEDAVQVFNRDVYFIDGVTLRNPTADTPDDARLFSVVGAGLEVTWGEWQAAAAQSTIIVTGGTDPETMVRLTLTGLVPNGVYSVFYGTLNPDSEHPQCQGVERTLPVSSFGPSQAGPDESSFVADASGSATFFGRIDGDLLEPLQSFFSIVYHFNGMTYHPFPNAGEAFTHDGEFGCRSSYGEDAMRHLIVFQKF